MDNLLKLEHENDVLQKRIEELEAEIEVWKTAAEGYAKIVARMNDMSELVGNIIDVFDDYLDSENAVIVGEDYDRLAEKIKKIIEGVD